MPRRRSGIPHSPKPAEMVLVRLARLSEVVEGCTLVKETHGRRVMLVRALRAPGEKADRVFATDPNCFHMGGNLWEGDIEDVGGAACIVCPLHRYRISLESGCKVDRDLCGGICHSPDQKQRTYAVHCDDTFIWVNIPDLAPAPLPSDVYNPVHAMGWGQTSTPARGLGAQGRGLGRGLGGASPAPGSPARAPASPAFGGSQQVATPPPALEPYGGVHARPMVPSPDQLSQATTDSEMEMLSQESGISFSQLSQQSSAAGSPARAPPPQQQQRHDQQGRINFPAQRAGLVRSRLAREAIMKKGYQPPMAPAASALSEPQQQQQQQQQPAAPARQPAARPTPKVAPGQQSLFQFGFTAVPRQVTSGPEDMDI
eukprot:scaffold28.g7594.t1